MEPRTKSAADDVNRHREDGEEAIKRTSQVVPLDAGKNSESVQVSPDSKSQLEESKSVSRKAGRGADRREKPDNRQR
jgi:hypothetical protein